ncbi:MAG: glycoside hydrolase family 57 protein [Steroidobacteraceae bacterium]
MSSSARLPVVLYWHMHQPHYRDALSGQYVFPWTYLHAIKDYVDMVAHLEANPRARAVVNFTPVLIEQLEELALRVNLHLTQAEPLPDAVLAMLSSAPLPEDPAQRLTLLRACLKADRRNLIERHPIYAELVTLATALGTPEQIGYASDQLLRDLAVWYHIAWMGETVRRTDLRIAALADRGRHFGAADRRKLLELIGELLAGVLPRYRRLFETGRCELCVSPYSHPIVPLLLDFNAARESEPGAPLPKHVRYPGGADRSRWHMEEAMRVFERVFGKPARGCWPSEGAISEGALAVIEESGIEWVASSSGVLRGALEASGEHIGPDPTAVDRLLNRAHRPAGRELSCFFRHDGISDLIGFTYSKWHGDDAAAHLVAELERLADHVDANDGAVALIALDGENAWEYYPYNGYYFLNKMYKLLGDHPRFELTTLSDYLDSAKARGVTPRPLPRVRAGSWVHGTLSTWMGDPAKNRGWDLLCDAKQAFDRVLAGSTLTHTEQADASRQLALCESSDWFWWFGDYNPPEAVRDFDVLFRHQLTNLYRLLRLEPPAALEERISFGSGRPEAGGVMRRAD